MLKLYDAADAMLKEMNNANGVDVYFPAAKTTKKALVVENVQQSQTGPGYQIFGVSKTLIMEKSPEVDSVRVGDELTIAGAKYRVTAHESVPRASIAPLRWVRLYVTEVT
jgi:hypothetical protein